MVTRYERDMCAVELAKMLIVIRKATSFPDIQGCYSYCREEVRTITKGNPVAAAELLKLVPCKTENEFFNNFREIHKMIIHHRDEALYEPRD